MNRKLEREVRRRARDRCEYCHLPEWASEIKHVADHIIAQQHHGPTTDKNLALCCGRCNQHKGPNLSGIDPATGRITALFNPRKHRWEDHFRWRGPVLVGRTPTGRATIDVLAINAPDRVATRQAVIDGGNFEG
jgi:hypothetical protein